MNESLLGDVGRVLLVVVLVAARDVLVALAAPVMSTALVLVARVTVLCAALGIVGLLTASRDVAVLALVLAAVVPLLITLRNEFGRPILVPRTALPVWFVLVPTAPAISLVGTAVTTLLTAVSLMLVPLIRGGLVVTGRGMLVGVLMGLLG